MKKPFTAITVVLLGLIAIVQFVRFISGWQVTIDGLSVPVWASAIACLIAAGLAVMVWIETRR
jgi:hypothetical protein